MLGPELRFGRERRYQMRARLRTYTAYSVGILVVWGVGLLLADVVAPAGKRHDVVLVFLGFAIGWLSATIARFVYPPPRRWRATPSSPSPG